MLSFKKNNLWQRLQQVSMAHYHLVFATVAFLIAFGVTITRSANFDYCVFLFLLAFAIYSVEPDIRQDVKWLPFLVVVIPLLLLVQYLNTYGYTLWGKMLSWQLSQSVIVDLNPLFASIPLNNAAFASHYEPVILTKFFQFVYQNGFVWPVLLPLYRALFTKDLRKVFRYVLSAHIFQVLLITPFYLFFHLQEVWFVLGLPDGMARNLTAAEAAGVTINCFPSMHTSIAFAMFLVLLNEKSKLFKAVWGFFCLSVIYSTMYLEIHWVIDVLGGLLLAWVTVKLVDLILHKVTHNIPYILRQIYFKVQIPIEQAGFLAHSKLALQEAEGAPVVHVSEIDRPD